MGCLIKIKTLSPFEKSEAKTLKIKFFASFFQKRRRFFLNKTATFLIIFYTYSSFHHI